MPKILYVCNCPDFTNQRPAQIFTRGFSTSRSDDWTRGNEPEAFDPLDQPVTQALFGQARACKHIYSAMLNQGDLDLSPTDFPLKSLGRDKLLPEEGFAGFVGVDRE